MYIYHYIYLHYRYIVPHMYATGPPIPIVALSAGIFHDEYGIYDDNQRKVLVNN